MRESLEHRDEGDASFETRQWRAEAEVGAVAETEVGLRRAGDVEHLGICERVWVVVGATEADQHLLAGGNFDAVEFDRRGRDPERRVGYRRREADELLDGCRHSMRLLREELQLI